MEYGVKAIQCMYTHPVTVYIRKVTRDPHSKEGNLQVI